MLHLTIHVEGAPDSYYLMYYSEKVIQEPKQQDVEPLFYFIFQIYTSFKIQLP